MTQSEDVQLKGGFWTTYTFEISDICWDTPIVKLHKERPYP